MEAVMWVKEFPPKFTSNRDSSVRNQSTGYQRASNWVPGSDSGATIVTFQRLSVAPTDEFVHRLICRLGDTSKSNFAATSKVREAHSVDLLTTNRYWPWSLVPAIPIYGGRGNRCLDLLTGNSLESINFESWHWHGKITPGCGGTWEWVMWLNEAPPPPLPPSQWVSRDPPPRGNWLASN